jgi:hypothetical protein
VVNKVQVPYEEAIKCPKCEHTGNKEGERSADTQMGATPGSRIHVYRCKNGRCEWAEEVYLVQVMPDGTVWMHVHTKRDKVYQAPKVSGAERRVLANLEYERQRSLQPGAEIRG